MLQRFRVEFIAHLREFSVFWRGKTLCGDSRPGVGLHTDEIILFRQLQPRPVNVRLLFRETAVGSSRLVVFHGEGQAYRETASRRLYCGLALGMRSQHVLA